MSFLNSTLPLFAFYKQLGEKAMEQISEEALNWLPDPESNSIALIVKHLRGNMRSRWTDFLSTDGEKPWRNRDEEFETEPVTRALLMQQWEEGWQCLFDALHSLSEQDLERIVYIRNDGLTVLEAIQRQLTHYAYHVGQIVYCAKMQCGSQWSSLSIPKKRSGHYNEKKFRETPAPRPFTDDLMK